MRDFSLDLQAERIHSPKTREYFNEVIKSYYGESYRSAVVMLYSIAIADLLYKIEELKELYNDENAIAILDQIGKLQSKNPKSSDWETTLIDLVRSKTNLIEPADFLHLTTLQQHRHLCAHPILTQNYDLYRPNRETTRAHIRNMLEGVLVKPPLLSRRIIDDLLSNLADIKEKQLSSSELERHLKTKYLDRLNTKTRGQIFRSLWKMTFRTVNANANENRAINREAVKIILEMDYSTIIESIANEKDYYSDIDEENLKHLILLLNDYPDVFAKLSDSIKILAQKAIEKSADIDSLAAFMSKDAETHVKKVLSINWQSPYEKTDITNFTIGIIHEWTINQGKRDLAYEFLIQMFSKSGSFDQASSRFEFLIKPCLPDFNVAELEQVIKSINDNSQIHARRRAKASNNLVREQMDKISDQDFDYTKYPNFD